MPNYLINSVRSGKGQLYADAGEEVKIISQSPPAVIVEYKGNRFATTLNNLTQTKHGIPRIFKDKRKANSR